MLLANGSGGKHAPETRPPGGLTGAVNDPRTMPRAGQGLPSGPRGGPPGALLEFDGGSGPLELGLGLLGVFFGGLLEHRLGGVVDQVLGFFQSEAGEGPDLFDDLDLLVAGGGKDDVELVLLLHRGDLAATPRGGSGGDDDRGGGGDAELFLEGVEELVELQDGHVLEDVQELGGGRDSHVSSPLVRRRRWARPVTRIWRRGPPRT